jgi:hypothetical protein
MDLERQRHSAEKHTSLARPDFTFPQRTEVSRLRWLAVWLSGIVLVCGVVLFVLHVGDIEAFLSALQRAKPAWIGIAVICQVATYACAASVWFLMIRHAGLSLPFITLFRLAFIELFANQAMPTGGLSGSVMVINGLSRRGIGPPTAMTALLLAALAYYAAYLVLGLLALSLLWLSGALSVALRVLFALFVFLAVGLAVGVLMLWRSRGNLFPEWLSRWFPVVLLFKMLEEVEVDPFAKTGLLVQAVVLQSGVFLLDAASFACVCKALDLDVGIGAVFASFMFASIAATLSPLPLGLGTFEGTSVSLLHTLGGGLEASLAATLILRGLTLWLPMLPGVWLVRREASV